MGIILEMGAAASLGQIPEELLLEEAKKGYTQHTLSKEVLSAITRSSFSTFAHQNKHKQKRPVYEIPAHATQFLHKIGISASSETNPANPMTTQLVGHIFECLGALQHLVRANQSEVPLMDDDTQSVCDMNTKSVGKLLHEMVSIYGLCGDTLKVLLEANPEAAGIEDNFGRLALHIAVDRNKPWLAAVNNLVTAYPEALMLRDGGGRIPLHIAVDRPEPSLDVIKLLVESNPASAGARRGVGRLPIHYCIFSESPSLPILRCIAEAYPEGLKSADVYGRLPLHYAVDKENPNLDIIKYLLDIFPDAARMRDSNLRLPLIIALERDKVDISVITELCNEYPESVTEPGPTGRLPLHFAVEAASIHCKVIRFLASRYPAGILHSRDGKDESTPLGVAIHRGHSECVRSLLLSIPNHNPQLLRDCNWKARKIAFLLLREAPLASINIHDSPMRLSHLQFKLQEQRISSPLANAIPPIPFSHTSPQKAQSSRTIIDYESDSETQNGNKTERLDELQSILVRLFQYDGHIFQQIVMFL